MQISTEILAAAEALKSGELVAFPTETVYGLGADASNDRAVAKVYEAKGRPAFNPLISHVHDAFAAFALGDFPPDAKKLALLFWPGPLTLVVPRARNCPVSLLASAGLPSLAIRIPDHPIALKLLEAVNRPIVAPSANLSGRISPTTAEHVRQSLGPTIAMCLDGGHSSVGVESTVISFMEAKPVLLRPGGLARDRIERALYSPLSIVQDAIQPYSPGQLESHYAPRARLRLEAQDCRTGETYLGFGMHVHGPYNLSASGDLTEAAANLFRMLHELDGKGTKTIAVAPIPYEGLGEAINDRLRRGAAPRGLE